MTQPCISRGVALEFERQVMTAIANGAKPPGVRPNSRQNERGAVRIALEKMGRPPGSYASLRDASRRVLGRPLAWEQDAEPQFERDELPDEIGPVEDIIARREKQFLRKAAATKARQLIQVRIKPDGPIGIVHFGDPHIDDNGTDIVNIKRHLEIIGKTEGMFGANVGDLQNNWVGRLAHLWSQQSVSAKEAWALTEWLVRSIPWLYLIAGNHDQWTGEGDPIKWMMRDRPTVFEAWGARLNLTFPNGKQVRINARHDFSGHSMWNTAHGPAKAVQMGWRDHILTCGHKHTSGYQVLKCPSTGLVSHAIRCGSFKVIDSYATEKGLPNQNTFPSAVTIIDPRFDDDDPRLVTTLFDVETGADFLRFLRKRKG